MKPLQMASQLVLAGLITVGIPACARTIGGETQNPAQRKGTSPAVKSPRRDNATVPVSAAAKPRTTTQPARIAAFETAYVYAKVAGYVSKVHIDIGDAVADLNKPLVELRIPEMKDEVDQKLALEQQAAAQVEQSAAAIQVAKSREKTADARVQQAIAGVARYIGAKKRWDAELIRLTKLAADGSVSEKLVDEARFQKDASDAALLEAKANVLSARASKAAATAGVKQAAADKKADEARQAVATANRKYAQTMSAYAALKPPFAGVVIERNVDVGNFVQPGDAARSKPLLVIAQTKTVRVVVEVPEADAPFITRGSKATVLVPSLGRNGSFPGKVSRTSFALNPRNRTLRVEIDLKNTTGRLRPGMYATAKIELADNAPGER